MKLHEFIDYLKGLDQDQDLIMGYGDNIIGVPKIGNNDLGTMLIVHIPIMFREKKTEMLVNAAYLNHVKGFEE